MTGKRGPSLTVARVNALLAVAGRGEDEIEAEINHLLSYGELEPDDLDEHERVEYDRKVMLLELARQAREILASRRKVKRTWRT